MHVKWSLRIGRLFGIGVYVHATFPLLLIWVAMIQFRATGSIAGIIPGFVFIAAVFTIVVMHELGHALTARRYGIATRDITLLPIGGIARLERMPRDPRQELLIALAGPAVNVVLAALLYVLLRFAPAGAQVPDGLSMGGGSAWAMVSSLVAVNIWLALFNLIPAFPMDGGRVLRAVLAMRSGNYTRATESAARVGRFFAVLFGVAGLAFSHPLLVVIAVFVWIGASAEAAAVQTTSMLEGVSLEQVMITDLRTVAPSDPLSLATQLVLDGFQQDFPVVEDGRVVGMLTRTELIRGLSAHGLHAPVSAVMHSKFETASPDEPVEEALTRLRACSCQAMPVVRGTELIGVLTMENVGEFMMVQAALRAGKAEPASS
jgi:Zn-dependent protease/CBS domain-containing protein